MTPTSKAAQAMTPCAECGMPCATGEYHPYAACLMFKACHNSETVRANLEAIKDHALAAQPSQAQAAEAVRLHVPTVIDHSHPNQAYVTYGFQDEEMCLDFIKLTRCGPWIVSEPASAVASEREAFEAWADKEGFGPKYRESMFEAWQARALLATRTGSDK